ncbi:hypothetical protein K3495_g9647 [Podosphaera aphanis]|nr:hypothetical protein K3495_g9647 [Podosphaera aphanis]
MDAFKAAEIERMRLGGNKQWREFFEQAESNKLSGITWDDATISERYSGSVGEEWKERLTAKLEGREYIPGPKVTTLLSASDATSQPQTPRSRTVSPANARAKVDDKYFAGLGAVNASRSADLPPSQGGKYSGFGSQPIETPHEDSKLPGIEDLQKDPVAALAKGFGWFTMTVAAHARIAATQVTKSAQYGAKSAAENFNRFVEGSNEKDTTSNRKSPLDESKKEFWDRFAEVGDRRNRSSSSVGTNAIKRAGGGHNAGLMTNKDDDTWGKW